MSIVMLQPVHGITRKPAINKAKKRDLRRVCLCIEKPSRREYRQRDSGRRSPLPAEYSFNSQGSALVSMVCAEVARPRRAQ
jgi:hypothetical protein